MIMGLNQPYFMPYIGYWQLINAVDVFVIGDDYNYIKQGWVNRNRIQQNKTVQYFGVEVSHPSSFKYIGEHTLAESFLPEKKMHLVEAGYQNAPYYEAGAALMEKILNCGETNLADFLEHSIRCVCDYLGITTKIIRSSSLSGNAELKREYRLFHACQQLGADTYINAIGGQELYDYKQFREHGIKLGFIQTGDVQYRQFGRQFIPYLSIIDVIMFNSKEEIREMLNQYTILWEESNGSQSAESEVN